MKILKNQKNDFPLTICRTSRDGRLNFDYIEGIVHLLFQILKLIFDPDVEWFTIEKGEKD